MIDWPASLPQALEVQGFSSALGTGAIRTEMDSGPAFQRQRYTAVAEKITGSVMIDRAQYATFMQFYADIGQGALAFNWIHPLTEDAARLRFDVSKPWQLSAVGPTWFRLTMQLEILP